MARYQLDARGLLCPMPVIRVQERIAQLAPEDVLEVTCSDPGAKNDVPAWCRVHGHEVLDMSEQGADIMILIRVGDSP